MTTYQKALLAAIIIGISLIVVGLILHALFLLPNANAIKLSGFNRDTVSNGELAIS
jgi:hypothetical protein